MSALSPWIRTRLLPEWEVIRTVLGAQTEENASKYIDEVCWRTYWKGWLQLRPDVWDNYLAERASLLPVYSTNQNYRNAINGRSGIDCFDTWHSELIETGYLHNHARMWYASIWVHTLELPWQLGADWFLRFLLDGDPASNTLSWRWVAGLHTRGKTYLASPDNIHKYTEGRFKVSQPLAQSPITLEEPELPKPGSLPLRPKPPSGKRIGLLITDDDLSASEWIHSICEPAATAAWFPQAAYERLQIDSSVTKFRRASMENVFAGPLLNDAASLINWAREQEIDGLILAEPPAGLNATSLEPIFGELQQHQIQICPVRHWWDEALYPHATHGFFRFKKAIPDALAALERNK